MRGDGLRVSSSHTAGVRVEGVGAVRFRAFGFEGFGLCRLWLQGLGEELWGLFRASGLMWEPDYGTLAL